MEVACKYVLMHNQLIYYCWANHVNEYLEIVRKIAEIAHFDQILAKSPYFSDIQ